MPARINRPASSFTEDGSLHDFILGYMNVSLSFCPFGDAVGQFSALTPWPASPEIPITAEMLLFSYWTPHRLGHQSVSFGFSHTEKEANGSFFFLSRRAEARENIAPQLTSNQIALGFHSLCPHSICTNHHGPPRISHPAQSNTRSFNTPSSPIPPPGPPPIDCSPLAWHWPTRACASMRAHLGLRQAWSAQWRMALSAASVLFNDIPLCSDVDFSSPNHHKPTLGRNAPVVLVLTWRSEQKNSRHLRSRSIYQEPRLVNTARKRGQTNSDDSQQGPSQREE